MSDLLKSRFGRVPPLRPKRKNRYNSGGNYFDSTTATTDRTIPYRLMREIGSYGERIALTATNQTHITYADLFGQINHTVKGLNDLGIGRGDRVALVCQAGSTMAVAFLGIAAGAICAPLNPTYREQEFSAFFNDLRPKALVVKSDTETAAITAAHGASIPIIELSAGGGRGIDQLSLHEAISTPAIQLGFAQSEDVALMLFTSGTTAQPKLVPLTHANLMASAYNIAATLRLTPDDRCLNIMPLFHIHGLIGGLLASLVSGGSVVCPHGFQAPKFFGWLEEFHPTWYTAVPTLHQAILARVPANLEIIRKHPLRFIRSSSAAMPVRVMEDLESIFNAPVIESYGMTEAAHQMASNPLPPNRRKPGSVGKAAGPEIAIMDGAGDLQPAGAIGEVVIRGANVMHGYSNSNSGNVEAFTHDWFRTGDQGYLDDDGFLYLTGRIKELINRAGEKISPREIDDALMAHPVVEQAVTFAVPHPTLGEEVAAAVMLRRDAQTTARELRDFVAKKLVDFKIPRQIVIVDDIPKSPTGKVQRTGLAQKLGITAADESATGETIPYEAPETELEGKIAQLWKRVLHLDQISRHDNLFHLGGDSILAAQIAARCLTTIGISISLIDLFEAPTIAGLATIAEAKITICADHEQPITLVSRDVPQPLSFAQEAVWFHHQLDPNATLYNRPVALRFAGPLNVAALAQSLNEVVNRHEALRTNFTALDGQAFQQIHPRVSFELTIVDLKMIPQSEQAEHARRIAAAEAQKPFDLSVGPMLRATLIALDDDHHILLTIFHHIVSDGWSDEVFFQQLARFYSGLVTKELVSLPISAIQYEDYAVWQRNWLQGEVLQNQVCYWKKQLSNLSGLQLPTDRPRPSAQSYRGAKKSISLPKVLADQLQVLSRKEGVTLFMTLLAALQVLLYRYTGQDDIAVGSPIAGRTRPETEGLIGFFVNTLVLRTDLSGNPTIRELLARVREMALGAYEHQDLPFEKLVEEIHPDRNLRRNPLFDVMFAFQNVPRQPVYLPGLTVTPVELNSDSAKFDFSLTMWEDRQELKGDLVYSTALFDDPTINRMLCHFVLVLQGMVANPDGRLSDLSLHTEAERHQLLVEWNDTKREYPVDKCIHQCIEAQVSQTPDAIAVVFKDREITYKQLNEQANQVAFLLTEIGIGKGSFAPILMDRSIEVVISMLAIMKVGAAFVPLDTNWPTDRIKQALEDLNSEVILVNKSTPYREVELGRSFFTIDEQATGQSFPNLNINIDAKDPIYAIYTSGSTGRPKAAVVPHRGITNRFFWMNEFFGCETAASVLQTTPHLYDSAVWQLFWPLINGGKTVIPSPGMEIVADHLSNLIERQAVTMTDFVPSVFNTIVPQLINDEAVGQKLKSLRSIVVGGEEITPATTYRFMEYFPQVRLVNLYGPTEASIGCICYQVTGKEGEKIPIGTPISNVQALILDKHMNPVPIGVAGELYLTGICLGLGYLNEEEKTAHAFINCPLPEFPDAKMYKTGDLARYLPDGNIEFLGRVDNQVKIRGFRIELGEIETALTQHPAVKQAIVVAREQLTGEKGLVAYVVASREQTPSIQEMRSFLKQKLPGYMVPSAFVFLDTLPLTPNGKIDRRALPAIDENNFHLDGSFVAGRTPEEEHMVRIWTEILKVNRVGIHDNFFDLGGHSLLATQVMSRVNREFRVDFPLRTLFEAPTVADMAAAVLQRRCESTEQQKLSDLLSELESLPDDDAERLLSEETDKMNEAT